MSSFSWPSSSGSGTSDSTPNNQPIPANSVLVAGENPSGNQQVLQTDSSGALIVTVEGTPGTPLATNLTEVGGAAVSLGSKVSASSIPVVIASDDTVATNITQFGGAAVTLGSKVSASSIPVVIASDDVVAVSATALPLPTGAATSANQTNASQKTQIVDGSGNVIASTSNALDVAVTQPLPAGTNMIGYVGLGPDAAQSTIGLTVRDTGSSTTSGADGQIIITGTPTAGSAATYALNTRGVVRFQVSGTWTGTFQVEVSFDGGTTYYQTLGFLTGTGLLNSSFVGNCGIAVPVPAATNIRLRMVAPSTGTANVFCIESDTEGGVVVVNALKLVDGSSNSTTFMAIKGPNTAPVAGDNAVVVTLSPNSAPTGSTTSGTAISNTPIQNVYSSTNITTSAYVQLVASTTNTTNTIHIFDSSGQAMILGIGGAGSEVTTLYVPPGGDTYTLNIPSGSRLAYKALTATANSGYLLMSFLE